MLLRALLFVCAASAASAADPGAAPVKHKPYTLVRFKADGIDPKAGIVWRVFPSAGVQRATTPRGVLEFVAPPGRYVVERLVIRTAADGTVEIDEWSAVVEIERDASVPFPRPYDPSPAEPGRDRRPEPGPKDVEPKRTADPWRALGRIQFGSAGCTATVMAPRRPDGRWDVLTAEHCVRSVPVGGKGLMQLRDRESRFAVAVAAKDRESDCAWLVTESADLDDLPFAELAAQNAPAGTGVWHGGFGVDRPGNREQGAVTRPDTGHGKAEMVLNVSSGDSGGGIFRADTGELVSCVCCTTERGAKVTMFGANVDAIRKLRPRPRQDVSEWWTPLDVPLAPVRADRAAAEWWTPVALPVCRS